MNQNTDRPKPEIVNSLQESPIDDSSRMLSGENRSASYSFGDGSTLTGKQISLFDESLDSERLEYQADLRKKHEAEAKIYRQELEDLSASAELDILPVEIKHLDEDREHTLTSEVLAQMQDAILGIEMQEIEDEVIDDEFMETLAIQAMQRKKKKS